MNIAEVIKTVFVEFQKRYPLEFFQEADINYGFCDIFAHDVCERVPGAVAIWNDHLDSYHGKPNHCFVFYKGKYYDSECPEGVNSWQELPMFVRARNLEILEENIKSRHYGMGFS